MDEVYTTLVLGLFDTDDSPILRGHSLWEWVAMAFCDFDEVDRIYIDSETQGGG